MSETLKLIMTHWTQELPKEKSFIDLPFNIENFCRENDSALTQAQQKLDIYEKALMYYSLRVNYVVRDEGRNYNTDNVVYEVDENTYYDVELGTRAREALEQAKALEAK